MLNYRAAEAEAGSLAEEVERLGRRAVVVQADVADPSQAEALAERALEALGRIDVLVNNAGVMEVRPFLDQDPDVMRWMLDVNISGTLALTRPMLP